MSSAVRSRFACSFQTAASSRHRTARETHANPRREFAVGPFSKEGLIPDCRFTAANLFGEASLYDPRSLPSFAQVAAHRGTPTDLWEAFCSLPEAHDHHLVHHVHVFTDGSVDFDEAQSSSLLPPSALSAGFPGVVFVACGKELLFLGAFWSPLFQHFSQCKTPSASQAELAAVAGTLKLFGNTLARHRVGLTSQFMETVCLQFRPRKVCVHPKRLCATKTCSVLTHFTRKDFVLLSQHLPIDIIHVSAHQGDIGNEFADFLANMAGTCVPSHSPSEWLHSRLDLNLLVSNDLVAERCWIC